MELVVNHRQPLINDWLKDGSSFENCLEQGVTTGEVASAIEGKRNKNGSSIVKEIVYTINERQKMYETNEKLSLLRTISFLAHFLRLRILYHLPKKAHH